MVTDSEAYTELFMADNRIKSAKANLQYFFNILSFVSAPERAYEHSINKQEKERGCGDAASFCGLLAKSKLS
jgi:hypothetical protein